MQAMSFLEDSNNVTAYYPIDYYTTNYSSILAFFTSSPTYPRSTAYGELLLKGEGSNNILPLLLGED
jgi:hypothetical protein